MNELGSQLRRRRRARALDRPGARARVQAELQPERRREPLQPHQRHPRRLQAAVAAVDRATQGLYPPGSAFKVVTAAAALDSGRFTPDSSFYDPGYCIEYGKRVNNFTNHDQNGPESFGNLTLSTGVRALGQLRLLQHRHGARRSHADGLRSPLRLRRQAADRPALERARGQAACTSTDGCSSPSEDGLGDPGRIAFGQGNLLVTPLQMAMVAGDGRERRRAHETSSRRRGDPARRRRSTRSSRSRSGARSSPRPRPS